MSEKQLQERQKRIVFIKTLQEMIGVSRMTLYRWIKKGKFPAPSKIESRNAWFLHEIEQWQAEKMGASNA